MTKQCGTCKWWDIEHKYVWSPDDMAACLAPFPDSICGDTKLMHKTEGQDCQVYEERKK